MCSFTVTAVLAFLAPAHTSEPAVNHIADLINKLENQAIKLEPLHDTDVNSNTLANSVFSVNFGFSVPARGSWFQTFGLRHPEPSSKLSFLGSQTFRRFQFRASDSHSSFHARPTGHPPYFRARSSLLAPHFLPERPSGLNWSADRCNTNPATARRLQERRLQERRLFVFPFSAKANKALHKLPPPERLPQASVITVRMPGDGACLFHAMAVGLKVLGIESEDGISVRNKIAKFIEKHPDHCISGTELREWISWDTGRTVEDYAKILRSGLLWGGGIEMRVFCHIWGVNLGVYEKGAWGFFKRISDFDTEKKQTRGTVLIKYSNRNHYDVLVSPQLVVNKVGNHDENANRQPAC